MGLISLDGYDMLPFKQGMGRMHSWKPALAHTVDHSFEDFIADTR
jgi:hypothetical protein